jgi:hypothetical protein
MAVYHMKDVAFGQIRLGPRIIISVSDVYSMSKMTTRVYIRWHNLSTGL